MKTTDRVLGIIVLVLMLLAVATYGTAQNVVRKGNNFTELRDSTARNRGVATKTQMVYTDSKGQTDTIYISSRGSAFIYKTSKKTGKVYRKYLPKVTEQLGTKKQ